MISLYRVVTHKVYLFLLMVLFFMLFMVIQAGHLKREFIKINNGEQGIRVALISDLHMGLLMVSEADAAKAFREEKPDLLIIAGDIIDKEKHISLFTQWVRSVSPGCPIFAVLGNHDHLCFKANPLARDLFAFNLKSLGVELLVNDSITFHKGCQSLNLVGIDDYRHGRPDVRLALSKRDRRADLTLAVAHNPETALLIPQGEVDLFLCGHFHGGQIWMPFNIEYRLLRKEETCKAGYRKGLHTINGTLTYISRGIGNVVVPLRLGSRPEITFIDL